MGEKRTIRCVCKSTGVEPNTPNSWRTKKPPRASQGLRLSRIERHSLMTSTTALSFESTITTSLPATMYMASTGLRSENSAK